MNSFDESIEQLRNLGERLVPHNFPMAPMHHEKYIGVLKKAEVDVDGYTLTVYFNKSRYDSYFLETFQIFSETSPFLPFCLVVKLAQKALGSDFLSLVEFYQNNHKVYCWSVCVDEHGKPIPSPIEEDSEPCEFEGFAYRYMNPEFLNFY